MIRRRNPPEGQALMIALILLICAAIMVLGTIFFFQSSARHHVGHQKIVQERYLAEAGLQIAMNKLNSNEAFSNQVQLLASGKLNPFDSAPQAGNMQWGGGSITVVIEPYD